MGAGSREPILTTGRGCPGASRNLQAPPVFALDVLACPRCGSRLRLLATVQDPAVVRAILAHLGLAPGADSPGPAPPQPDHTAATG